MQPAAAPELALGPENAQPEPPPYAPGVTVSALALRDIPPLPYTRFRLHPCQVPSGRVSDRAKWLEHGAGSVRALSASALALLVESLPSALSAVIHTRAPSPQKPQSDLKPSPRPNTASHALWVFAPAPVLAQAKALVADAFTPEDEGVWTPHAHSTVTSALLQAFHRAITASLEADGALSIGSELVHPTTQLAYSFRLSVPAQPAPHVLVRVAVRNRRLRRLDDVDSARVLAAEPGLAPLKVISSPLGMEAVLAPRPMAGDALSASVLKRWREAGLLPAGDLVDSAVVFVRLKDGIVVPFPRACLLTAEPKVEASELVGRNAAPKKMVSPGGGRGNAARQDLALNRKQGKTAGGTPRSRKRPRSPSSHVEEVISTKVEPKKEVTLLKDDPLLASEERYASSAPTAQSLNDALDLAKKKGVADPVPVLHHPIIDPIPPPTFDISHDQNLENGKSTSRTGPTTSETHSSPNPTDKASAVDERGKASRGANGVLSSQQPDKSGSSVPLKVDTEPKPSHSGNGIDSFLLDGDSGGLQEACSGFGSGPSVDMNDFGAFEDVEDEVTEYFQNGMEDRLQGTDNTLSNAEETGAATQNRSNRGDRDGDNDVSLSQSNADANRQNRDAQMDVDTDGQKDLSDTSGSSGDDRRSKLRGRDVMAMALSTLRKSTQIVRPDDKAVGSKVKSFFEDDLTERRLVRLGVVGSLGKRRARSKFRHRRLTAQLKHDTCSKPQKVAVSAFSGSSLFTITSQLSYSVGKERTRGQKPDFYIPKRRLKTFNKLRKEGRDVIHLDTLIKLDTDETDLSDSDNESVPDALSSGREGSFGELRNSAETLMLGESLPKLPPEHKSLSQTGSAEEEDGTDCSPTKIMETVAVDCASACMVLAASRSSRSVGSPILGTSGNPTTSSDGNGSPVLSREDDLSKGLPPHAGAKPGMYSSVPKVQALSQSSSPISRSAAPSKRDRELLGLLTLLEMQSFSVRELDLFKNDEDVPRTDQFALKGKETACAGQDESDVVSVATVRRVLMGLPRVLETSRIFSSCWATMRELGDSPSSLKVLGPLAVRDVLGEGAAVFPLDLPRVCIGYNKNWVEAPSGVLPLWEKAGLEPYSERKNVEYVAVAPKEMESDVKLFLRDVSAAYEECSFGRHAAMHFDAITLIANSKSKSEQRGRQKSPELLSETDRAMAQQYHLAITGLCTKLATVAQDYRKCHSETAKNIVVYVISPFENNETAANVFLLKGLAPLVCSIPGTVPSMVTTVGPSLSGTSLPAAPWRSTVAPRSIVSITVRVLPREVVDRHLSGHAEIECLLDRPLRPQLVKAVSFAVFSSIRSKRVRTSQVDGEVARLLTRSTLMPDDLMSPMTPEIAAESPGGSTNNVPVSPKGGPPDEMASPQTSLVSHSSPFLDQFTALAPSFLHEPAIVLSGVGKHMGQADSRADIVLHLAYMLCESSSRYVFVWTDQRGEMLDIATVPVSKVSLRPTRRKAFWCMWARGQRWKISFVQQVHATVCKLGDLAEDEVQDWDWVIARAVQRDGPGDRKPGAYPGKVVRRFPRPDHHIRGDDVSELYTDHPTPATPGVPQTSTHASAQKTTISMEIKMPAVSSVSILSASRADEHLLMEASERKAGTDRRDFAVVAQSSLSKGASVQASAVLAGFEEEGLNAIELNMFRHYGQETEGEEMSDERSPWDASSAQAIANSIVMNFHELRYVGSPPSWPCGRWLSIFPVHLDIVRRFALQIRNVHRFALTPSTNVSK